MTTSENSKPESACERNATERRRAGPNPPRQYRYYTYGLRIRSELPLPELDSTSAVDHSAPEDAEVLLGNVSAELEGGTHITSWLQAKDDCCIIDGENIARYKVERGSRITVDRRIKESNDLPVQDRDIRAYLLGTAFGALLHQRQFLPLHVSAVGTPSGVLAFTGPSGAGKSTMAAWLNFRFGLPLVTDDIGVIRPAEETPFLYPGPPRLKLWDDAIEALGLERATLIQDLTRVDKFHLPNIAHSGNRAGVLRQLVVLKPPELRQSFSLKELHGAAAYRAVIQSVYRPGLNNLFYRTGQLHIDAGTLARKIRIYSLERPLDLAGKGQMLEQLLRELGVDGGND